MRLKTRIFRDHQMQIATFDLNDRKNYFSITPFDICVIHLVKCIIGATKVIEVLLISISYKRAQKYSRKQLMI